MESSISTAPIAPQLSSNFLQDSAKFSNACCAHGPLGTYKKGRKRDTSNGNFGFASTLRKVFI